MTNPPPPPGWYPDQQAPQLLRWWDGRTWTSSTQPAQQAQPPQHAPAAYTRPTGGTLFSEPVLLVNQRAKMFELTNEYTVSNQAGQRIGSIIEVGQGGMQKAIRLFTKYDQFLTHKFEIRDASNSTMFKVMRPAKVIKSKFLVTRADDSPIGEIVQANVFGKIRFDFTVNGQPVGAITAENWLSWDFEVTDQAGNQIARVDKKFQSLFDRRWSTADNYAVHIPRPLQDPLATLVVAAALTIDTALNQDAPPENRF
ncbi:MAG: scramblase family protein [Amycolatopsis sp.]|jgi:uncharacterized protein YxjI|uniref:phospholipid scramblase-related protein n=1 Tax=Amycolatopsis sp. TaxID=37632 RepID=UPI00260A1B83|nr:phospholipid scramblase-related protein [Amycolatopsis sp.]MCU1686220.1 scramblase family protein [Amycolatopsis sp.]